MTDNQNSGAQPQESNLGRASIGPDQREQAAIAWLQHALDGDVSWRTAVVTALSLLRTAVLERAR